MAPIIPPSNKKPLSIEKTMQQLLEEQELQDQLLAEHAEEQHEMSKQLDSLQYVVDKVKNSPFINGGFDTLSNDMKILKEDVTATKKDINEIKDKLHDPDNGLYARLVTVDNKTVSHQKWFDAFAKLFWIFIGSGATVLAKLLFEKYAQ